MGEYTNELLWLISWPVVIYIMVKVSINNILKFEKKD